MSDFTMNTKAFDNWADGVDQNQPRALNSMKNYMLRETRRRYRLMESPGGRKWKKTKHKGKRHFRTLYARGDLFRSIVGFIRNNKVVGVGTNLVYAAVHQYGYKEGGIPKREFLGFSKKNVEELKNIVSRWFMKGK